MDRSEPAPGAAPPVRVPPDDDANRELVTHVHPFGWRNPTPAGRYNAVVLGAGTGGLVAAAAVAGLGGRVALVERRLMGGDCLNVGCVPSKAILASARAAAGARAQAAHGVRSGSLEINFPAVMERMRRVRAGIAPTDSVARFSGLGVDVFLGHGRFSGPDAIDVDGARLRFARAVIATGSRPAIPPVEGLADAGYLTNETAFELTELPARLVVLGAGPIGLELAQAFARLGARVTVIELAARPLPGEDADASAVIAGALERDGVHIVAGARARRVHPDRTVVADTGAGEIRVPADAILVATGRTASVDDLGLDRAGVGTRHGRVEVDDRLRTANRRVYAVGDVCSPHRFTHAADAMARIAVKNALFFGRDRVSDLVIPRVIYTEPELAHAGLTAAEATERGVEIDSLDQPLEHVDRAVVDGATEGFVRVHVRRGSDRIVGATAVGAHAGEIIHEVVLAMQAGLGLGAIADAVHAYPTWSLALKQVGDLHRRSRVTPRVAGVIAALLRWRRW